VDTLALESFVYGLRWLGSRFGDAFPRETVAIFNLAKQGRHQERGYLPLVFARA